LNANVLFCRFFFNLTQFLTNPRVLVLVFHYFTDISIINILSWDETRVSEYKFNTSCDTQWVLPEKKGSRRLSSFQNTSTNNEVMYIGCIASPPITPKKNGSLSLL
jgi:hypothetical protein